MAPPAHLLSSYFEALPDDAIAVFCKNVMQALPTMRNKLGGHGRSRDAVEPPVAYGKLAVNLAAAIDLFLIELAIARGDVHVANCDATDVGAGPMSADDDTEFTTAPGVADAGDDDIPF